jgi:hypothetical protein
MPEEKPEWEKFADVPLMNYIMRGVTKKAHELMVKIPTYAAQCLKCHQLHLFSELLIGCPNCSGTRYGFGGQPAQFTVICRTCKQEVLQTVKCPCGCVNPLTEATMRRQKSGGCFVATAACGSPVAAEVIILTHFRDAYLSRNMAGRAFVWCYYAVSPTIAAIIAKHDFLRRTALRLVIRPAVWLVQPMCTHSSRSGKLKIGH